MHKFIFNKQQLYRCISLFSINNNYTFTDYKTYIYSILIYITYVFAYILNIYSMYYLTLIIYQAYIISLFDLIVSIRITSKNIFFSGYPFFVIEGTE